MSKAKKKTQPDWHPDFRITEELPDIKVVRTDFLVNGLALLLMLVLGVILAQRELKTIELNSQIESIRTELDTEAAENRANLALNKEFQEAMAKIEDLNRFYTEPFLLHQFLAGLATQKPDDIRFSGITIDRSIVDAKGKKKTVEYALTLNGQVRDPQVLFNFKQTLNDLLDIRGDFASPTDPLISENVSSTRNEVTGTFGFTLRVVLQLKV